MTYALVRRIPWKLTVGIAAVLGLCAACGDPSFGAGW